MKLRERPERDTTRRISRRPVQLPAQLRQPAGQLFRPGGIRLQDVFKVMFKELRVSLLVGAILAVVNGIRVLIMNRDPVIAIVVGLALLCSVVIAKFIGCMMPMLATRLKLDPALMASPLITTIVDACSITIFFSIAVAILGIAM